MCQCKYYVEDTHECWLEGGTNICDGKGIFLLFDGEDTLCDEYGERTDKENNKENNNE